MKQKHNAGYTLIEVLVAISLLGILVVPICSNLVISLRVNAKTDEMLHAQLAVSSAVETLMAEGISQTVTGVDSNGEKRAYDVDDSGTDRFAGVLVQTQKVDGKPYYAVTVESETIPSVRVETYIRAVASTSPAGEGG